MAKITRKSYKRNKVVLGASLFAGIALISTGFAAFVISAAANNENKGNVTVGITKNTTLKITDTTSDEEKNFSFEPNKTEKENPYVHKESDEIEKLSVVVTGKIENAAQFKRLSVKLAQHEGVDKAVAGGYIVAPECYNKETFIYNVNGEEDQTQIPAITDDKDGVKIESDGTYTFKATVAFTWGSKFEGINPSEFYSKEKFVSGEVNAADASKELDTFRADMLNMSYEDYVALSDSEKASKVIAGYTITVTAYVD